MRSRLRLPQDGNLLKGQRLDSYLFLELAHERVSRRLPALAVPSNDVPYTRVEGPTLRALCQKNLVAAHQKTTSTDSYRTSRRQMRRHLYITARPMRCQAPPCAMGRISHR